MNAWLILYLLDQAPRRGSYAESELADGDLTGLAICWFSICLAVIVFDIWMMWPTITRWLS